MPPHQDLALVCEAHDGRAPLAFAVRRVVCAGHAGRDPAEVERHVQELVRLGIPPPAAVPMLCSVGSYLATVTGPLEVQGSFTSGEVEPVVLVGPGGSWVGIGSDHTDRFIERQSVSAAKQLCPKFLAPTVWPMAEVEGHWDDLWLRAWVLSGRARRLYQEATLAALLPPATLLRGVQQHAGRDLTGLALFAGTVPTVSGEIVFGDGYELELRDPRLGRVIRAQYAVHVLERR